MKNQCIKYSIASLLLASQPVFADATLFEDFSGSEISLQKFWGIEKSVRLDTTNENLVFSSRSKSFSAGYRSNNKSLRDTDISMLQADIVITDLSLGNADTQNAMLGIAGTYYNSESANPASQLGDVYVRLALGDRGNGPEAWYELQVSLDAEFNSSSIVTGSFGAISTGTVYPIAITYDGDNTFTFSFNNGTTINLDGPPRLAEAVSPFRGIGHNLRFGQINATPDLFDEGPDDGTPATVTGTVDNVASEVGLLDDFSGANLDQSVWWGDQTSVALVDGKMQMRVTGQGDTLTERFWIKQKGLNSFGASMTLSSGGTVNDTTRVRGRLTHYLSNDTFDVTAGDISNGWEGFIWTQFMIERSGGNNRVVAYAERSADANWDTWEELFWEVLGPINLDQEYALLIQKTGTLVEYIMDGVVLHSFDLATDYSDTLSGNDYIPIGATESGLHTRIQNDAGEAHVLFDDIVTDHLPQVVALNAYNGDDLQIPFPAQAIANEGEVVDMVANVADPTLVEAYLWEQVSGPKVALARGLASKIIGTDQVFSFTVPAGSDNSTLSFKVTIVDQAGMEMSQGFDISVDQSAVSTLGSTAVHPPSGGGGGAFNALTLVLAWLLFICFGARRLEE